MSPGKAAPCEQHMLLEDPRQNASCVSQNTVSSPFFLFSTFFPHLTLCSGGSRGSKACVLLCILHAPGKPGLSGLEVASHSVQVSSLLCFWPCNFLHISWEVFLHCEKVACVVALDKLLLGASQETWATVTEPVHAGEGHFGFVLLQTQRDDASTFAWGLGGRLAAASVWLREHGYFLGKKRREMAFVLVAERNQVLHLQMQCGVVASSVSYTFWLHRSLNFI